MPTVITVPIGQRAKSIQFGAAYSPSLTFNPDKKLLVGCSGILSGMGVTVNTGPIPAEITVDAGAFIQRGIIVNVTSSQLVQFPSVPTFPLYLVAENANETFNSSVQYLFTTSPAADSCIIASWPFAPITAPEIPIHISNCGLAEAIAGLNVFVIQHDRQVAGPAQTIFTIPPAKAYVLGSNKLFVYRNGKKLVVNDEYAENTPTQFTLNFPATSGDVMDLIVYKGAPPITSIALDDLTDMTSNLSKAIKDPSSIRSALATQANPLATIADIPALSPLPEYKFLCASGPGTTINGLAPATSIFGSIIRGAQIIPSTFWGLGKTVRITAYGNVFFAGAARSIFFSTYLGTLVSGGGLAFSGPPFSLRWKVTSTTMVIATGISPVGQIHSLVEVELGPYGGGTYQKTLDGYASTNFDTTIAALADLRASISGGNSSDLLRTDAILIEGLG